MSRCLTNFYDTTLGNICTKLVNGGTPSTNIASYWGGKIPWVTGADFTTKGIGEIRRYITGQGIRASSASVVMPGNLLVVTRTGVGKLAVAKEPIAISQDITGVYINGKIADTLFVYYLLQRELENLKKLNQGTSINGIIRADFQKHPVSIPRNVVVQRGVARILQTIDQTIELTESLIEKYQQIKAGLMHDLFTRGVTADGKLRPTREQAPELYQETPIGWIPKEWQYKLLDRLTERKSGHTPNRDRSDFWNGGVKWISLADSKRLDRLYVSDTDYEISQLGILNSSAVMLPAGVVVMSRDAGVGKSAITTESMAVSQHFMAWICGEQMDNHFLYYWLQHNKRNFENIAMGSTIVTIGLPYFKSLKVLCPKKLKEQELIGQRLKTFDTYIYTLEADREKLLKQKSGLMHDLLTGEVPVKVSEPEVAHV